ncbi:hypothetical protein E4U57_003371 [Claviceps arundinis]|uniref:Uncharacterized protein n=1 Tax=Claviceps arundinis TaxID=1623583 RepID=A0A9P7SMC6_9HYPO|nr:hypothetical protein E4U57_003371 [Claviceps arundinis]KAG5962606.1 hypothetical protein E4U56_003289 [Claviceps arundinis]
MAAWLIDVGLFRLDEEKHGNQNTRQTLGKIQSPTTTMKHFSLRKKRPTDGHRHRRTSPYVALRHYHQLVVVTLRREGKITTPGKPFGLFDRAEIKALLASLMACRRVAVVRVGV